MSNEQDNLRNPEPICSFCYNPKENVKVLAKIHRGYICDACCKEINKLMYPLDPPPDNEPRRTA